MKKIPAIALLASLFLAGMQPLAAQMTDGRIRLGFKAGINGARLYDDVNASNAKTRIGMTAGAFVQIPLAKGRFALRPELLFTTKGGAYDFVNAGRTDFKVNYVELPLVLEYRLLGFINLHVGGYAATLASADGTIGGSVVKLGKANFENFDYGWVAGTGLDIGALGIHFRISRGLQEVSTQSVNASLRNVKNATWSVALSYGL